MAHLPVPRSMFLGEPPRCKHGRSTLHVQRWLGLCLGWFCFLIGCLLGKTLPAVQPPSSPDSVSKAALEFDASLFSNRLSYQASDATLQDVHVATLDRAWTVGDRGLILATTDSGKHWIPQISHVTCPLYAIEMQNDREGWIVGGTVHGNSQRSVGVVLGTNDGGKNWRLRSVATLPRLVGLQHLGRGHLIAWGDYSPELGSSLFESIDGGFQWSPIAAPIGHLRSSAWTDRSSAILLDRAYRAFKFDGSQLVPISLPPDVARQLHFVRVNAQGIWLGGSNGTLLRSFDGDGWDPVSLPMPPEEQALLEFTDVYADGKRIVVADALGRSLWYSEDAGKNWQHKSLPPMIGLNAIHSSDGERMVAVGPMARILGSRNGGQAWWNEHTAGDRLGVLAIAHDASSIPWEPLATATWQHARHAAAYVMHSSHLESSVDIFPDAGSMLDLIQSELGLASLEREEDFPANYVDQSRVQLSLAYRIPQNLAPRDGNAATAPVAVQRLADSPIVRKLVRRIRVQRPEVVFVGRRLDAGRLEGIATQAALLACSLAADRSYRLFSQDSPILDEAWEVPKVYGATDGKSVDLACSQEQMLTQVGLTMREVLASIEPLARSPYRRSRPATLQGWVLQQDKNFSSNTRRDLFGGLSPAQNTMRLGIARKSANYQALSAVMQWRTAMESLARSPGPKWEQDLSWESRLDELLNQIRSLQSTNPTDPSQALFDMAHLCREMQYWNRWRASLFRIVRFAPGSDLAEAATLELLTYGQSAELMKWTTSARELDLQLQTRIQAHASVAVTTQVPASPFAKSKSRGDEVRQASFVEPSTDSNTPQASRDSMVRDPSAEPELISNVDMAATRILPFPLIEPAMQSWLMSRLQEHSPSYVQDPRIQILAERLTQGSADLQKERKVSGGSSIFQRLAQSPSLAGWSQLGEQEQRLASRQPFPNTSRAIQNTSQDIQNAMRAHRTTARPWLDGVLDEPMWRSISATRCIDPWGRSQLGPTTIQFAYDDEYLYLGLACPIASPFKPGNQQDRLHDSMDSSLDHVSLRLDVDRDYATWFGFGVDRKGQLEDTCCGIRSWNPSWFVASKESPSMWQVEIAIPLAEIATQTPVAGEVWCVQLERFIPNDCIQHNGRIRSDSVPPQGMRLLQFQAAE